jgi:hypothetical protein
MITRGNPWTAEARRNPYPFVDTASLTDATGLLRLSQAWIGDAKLWPSLAAPSRIYLSAIERTTAALTISVSSLDSVIGSATILDFTRRRVALRNHAGDPVGFLAFAPGALQHIHDVPSKVYQFSVAATEFVASAISLQVANGLLSLSDNKGATLTRDFSVVGGEGVVLSVRSPRAIRVDVIGDPYYRRETCEDPTALGRALKPVRGVHFKDMTSGGEGIVTPYGGNISTTVVAISEDPKARGYMSPGPKLVLLSRIGG